MINELQTPGSFPLIQKLGLEPINAASVEWLDKKSSDIYYYVRADELEKLLRNNRREPTDFGYPATDEVFVLKISKTLEPITKDELLALMNDFYLPQSGFTEPDIKMLKLRLQTAGVKND